MTQATRKKCKQQSPLSLSQRLREGILIVTIAVSAFLLLALFTYHRSDPGWSHAGQSAQIINAGGVVGAYISDILLYVFGYLAFIFPLMLSYSAWLFFKARLRDESDFKYYYLSLHTAGYIFILASSCALASLEIVPGPHLPFTAGGIIGNVVGFNMIDVFNPTGTDLILTAILLAGITLFTGLSWLKVMDILGKGVCYLLDFIHCQVLRWWWSVSGLKLSLFGPEAKLKKITKPKIVRLEPNIDPKELTLQQQKSIKTNQPKPIKTSVRAESDKQTLLFQAPLQGGLPPLTLLDSPDLNKASGCTNQELETMSRLVESKILDFNIDAKVVAVHPGPVVTRYELQLAAGTKVNKVTALVKDLARSLSVTSVRIVEVIPGKSVIGLELPNKHREIVRLREVLASEQYEHARSPLSLALGKDVAGHPVVVDLAKMPHLLVAGTTGSGKSVGLNGMLLSLLHKASPKELRLIMIDPKMLELSVYDGIPHLLTPVVTDMKDAANALRWCVVEMDRRYKLMASLGVRNLAGFNHKVKDARKKGSPLLDPLFKGEGSEEPDELRELPYVVVVADEFADMMMVVGKKVEELIARIAQKARAAGIHLVLATQRPSVDVITGLIKANIPTRIAFQVSSKVDSRTILDQQGAEQLLGNGDMLYLPPGSGVPVRVHGAFVGDDEVHRVVKDWKKRGKPEYLDEITECCLTGDPFLDTQEGSSVDAEEDALYDQAVEFVLHSRRASISSVQRRLKIGYNRAARIIEAMEAAGLVGPMENNGAREILVPAREET